MKKLLLITSVLLLASCGSTTRSSIENDRKAVGNPQTEEQVIAKASDILKNSKLTEKQKKQFVELYSSNRAEALSLEEQIREYRLVLLKTLVDKNFSQRKFDTVAAKIKKLILKRYDLAMMQYREGKKILGVSAASIYDDPWFEMMHKF